MLVVALSYATVSQGAFYPHQFRVLAVLVAVALAAAGVRGRLAPASRHPLALLFGGLAVVALASGWSAGAVGPAVPMVAFLAVAWAAFAVAGGAPPVERRTLVVAVVGLAVLVAAIGVAAVAFRRAPFALVDGGLWRAASTLTYANATAGFLLVPAFLALARVVLGAASASWSLAAYVLVVGLVATLSRGGTLAFVTGAAVLAATVGARRAAARSWPVLAGAAIAALGLVPGMPDRLPARPGVAVLGVVAGAAVVLVARRRRGARALGAVLAAAATAAAVAAALGAGGDLVSTRLTAASPDRLDGWGAAIDVFADRPVLGTGPGHATYAYVDDRGEPMVTRFVHNEYLQVLAETGLAGAVVVAGGLAFTIRRVRRRSGSGDGTVTGVGVLAGLVAFCVHSALDFLWHVPIVPLAAIVVVGIAGDGRIRPYDVMAVEADEPSVASRAVPR